MKNRKLDFKLFFIMLVAIFSRVFLLGVAPGGVHADEAFAGYEAYSLANYGMDSWGYVNPVYLAAWGSGMNALETYLMIPYVKICGLNIVAIRIPQMILGILSVYIFFLLVKMIADRKIAYGGAAFLAISPWHIMMSRYALESNLGPAFILCGIYFGLRGLKKKNCFWVSAVFWGLSLYAYAVNWLFVPLFLLGCLVYCFRYHQITFSREVVGMGVILLMFAIPLLLFVAVNMGWMSEIRTAVISIPRLQTFRSGDVDLANIFPNMIKFLKLLIKQNDDLLWNSTKYFGIYYLFSTPFVVYGGWVLLKRWIERAKRREFGYEFIILWWGASAVFVGLLQGIGINRLNYLWMAMLILLTVGVYDICHRLKKYVRWFIIGLYAVSFLAFEVFYFGEYQTQISERQNAGAGEAIAYALQVSDGGDIYVIGSLRHSQVLFYTAYATTDYLADVEWSMEYGDRDVSVHRIGQFCWDWDVEQPSDGVYIILATDAERYRELGYEVTKFQYCAVAVK